LPGEGNVLPPGRHRALRIFALGGARKDAQLRRHLPRYLKEN